MRHLEDRDPDEKYIAKQKREEDRKKAGIKEKERLPKRDILLKRDGDLCFYCGGKMDFSTHADVTIEHLIPKARGGTRSKENLVLAHGDCNSKMGSKNLNQKVNYAINKRVSRLLKIYRKPEV